MKEKLTEIQVRDKIDSIKSNGIVFYEPLNKNVRIYSYSYWIGERKIQLCISYGFGASEQFETFVFYDWEIDEWLRKFKPKNNVDSKQIKYKYTLKMSTTTDNNIQGLRDHLFKAIEKLEGGTMKADEAKAMASLAQTIINSAKLELDYKRMIEKQPDIKMLND